jgi:hypothetical protein
MLGVLLPFASDVRQPWTDLGILAGYGMVAVAGSYGLRRWVSWRAWRLLHYAAFPLWLVGLVHGIGAGSDARQVWAVAVYLASTAAVVYLVAYRALRAGRRVGAAPLPPALRDRATAHGRIESFRIRCASLSSKTKPSSPH